MSEKLKISVLCGGQSTEHEVSVNSARNVVMALNPQKYDIIVIFIDHHGNWYRFENLKEFHEMAPASFLKQAQLEPVTVVLGGKNEPWISLKRAGQRYGVDCIFPVLHGTNGEDGSLQGMLDLVNIPYVGADTQSSAICMEKDIAKSLLRAANIPTLDWHTVYPAQKINGLYHELTEKFGPKMFVKPTSLGSSVGTVPVASQPEFNGAVEEVFRLDERAIIEPRVYGRELECSVLGNAHPKASLPGEIILHHDFYSYEAKYLDPNGATTQAPAKLSAEITEQIQKVAVDTFKTLHCSGMARVDFFLTQDQKLYVNEVNTIPGFTNISMYPKMWEVSGLKYGDLIDELIRLALDRHRQQQSLIRIYQQ